MKCDVSRWSIANLSYLLEHTPSQSLYLCLLCSSLCQLPAPVSRVHEAEVEGTRAPVGRSSQHAGSPKFNVLLPVAMGNPLATHTEASTKLITAQSRSQRDYN